MADAVARSARPIRGDDRIWPRDAQGRTNRDRYDRAGFPPARQASTLLALYPGEDGGLVVPLTVRRDELRAHAGEVSLPGGAVDRADANREAAALREAWEEIGLEPNLVRMAGALDDIWIPVSNFDLRPFVGTVSARPALTPQDAEVAAIVELPLAALYEESAFGVEELEVRGLRLRAGVYRHAGLRIWGATAGTLGMLAAVLAAGD